MSWKQAQECLFYELKFIFFLLLSNQQKSKKVKKKDYHNSKKPTQAVWGIILSRFYDKSTHSYALVKNKPKDVYFTN
jgi:hypothetical protein